MNINNLSGGSPERISGGSSKINSPHAKFNSKTTESANSTHAQHTRDPELVGLVRQLADTPEIRLEKIAEAQQKIQSGDFFSRQTAVATAEAFLR